MMELPQKKEFHGRFSIRLYFALIVMGEILLTIGLAYLLFSIFDYKFSISLTLPTFVWLIIFSAIIGSGCAFFVNRFVFMHISKLNNSMKQVAGGNFTIRLTTKSKIREIRESYESFNLMVHELGATETLQTDFVSNVSHEFKTPINAIEGYATLLQDKNVSEEERDLYVAKILFNTKRLSELVGNILLLSKVDNQVINGQKTTYRLDEQIRQAIVLLEEKWEKRCIEFDAELPCIHYMGNESLLLHVFSNLIDNAIKFSPRGGTIHLSLMEADDFIRFTVRDEGPGIPEDSLERIFGKFYQCDSSHKAEGNGLGLALVKQILSRLGGTIRAENHADGGAQFTIDLMK